MTRYEVIQAIPVENIARMILEVVKMYPEEKELTEWLKSELTKEELQVIEQIAQSGNYPLSFSGI